MTIRPRCCGKSVNVDGLDFVSGPQWLDEPSPLYCSEICSTATCSDIDHWIKVPKLSCLRIMLYNGKESLVCRMSSLVALPGLYLP